MTNIELIMQYCWVGVISVVGAIVGFYTKVNPIMKAHTLKQKLVALGMGIISSGFISYLTFEFMLYKFDNYKLAVVAAGIASFTGTDLAVVVQTKVLDLIKSYFDKITPK